MPVTKTARRADKQTPRGQAQKRTFSHRLKDLPTVGNHRVLDLRKLPKGIKEAIQGPELDRALNMANLQELMAGQVADYVVDLALSLPPEKQGEFVSLAGVDQLPDLGYLARSRSGREALVRAFRKKLDTQEKRKAFENASFALQADAYSDCDQGHPLCTMWHAGGLHMALYGGLPYDDAAVRRAWEGGRRRGRRQTRRRKDRSKRRERGKRSTRRRSRHPKPEAR